MDQLPLQFSGMLPMRWGKLRFIPYGNGLTGCRIECEHCVYSKAQERLPSLPTKAQKLQKFKFSIPREEWINPPWYRSLFQRLTVAMDVPLWDRHPIGISVIEQEGGYQITLKILPDCLYQAAKPTKAGLVRINQALDRSWMQLWPTPPREFSKIVSLADTSIGCNLRIKTKGLDRAIELDSLARVDGCFVTKTAPLTVSQALHVLTGLAVVCELNAPES